MPAELADTLTATEDDRLEQAEALVRGFCGWHIAPSREDAVTVRGQFGATTLLLPSLYVTDVTSVTDDSTLLTVEDDYTWSEAGVLTRTWWSNTQVEVEFTHGYAVAPPEVTAIVQAIAQRAVNNPGSLSRWQSGPFSETYSTTGDASTMTLLDSEKETLRRYRIPAVG